MTIFEKLGAIQCDIKAPKNMFNSFGKYKYRNAEGIFEALKPYLTKYRVALMMFDDVELIGDKFFLKSTACLYDTESDATIQNHAYAELDSNHKGMSAEQMTGCCSSYCRKYALNAMFLLDDTKDADSDEYHEQTEKAQTRKRANATVIPSCERCGGEIVAMPTADGEMSATAVYAFSKKKYNACYCGECMKKLGAGNGKT